MILTGTPGEVDKAKEPPTTVAAVIDVMITETSQLQNINWKEK